MRLTTSPTQRTTTARRPTTIITATLLFSFLLCWSPAAASHSTHSNIQNDTNNNNNWQQQLSRFQEQVFDALPLSNHVLWEWELPMKTDKESSTVASAFLPTTVSPRRRLQEEDEFAATNRTQYETLQQQQPPSPQGTAIPGDDLIVLVTFRDLYKTIFFIGVAWMLGMASVAVGLPSLVGEIAAGFLLGPPLADFVPYPGALVLTGNIGLIGLILESGISLDVAQLKEVGHRAFGLAIVGSALPLLTGFGIGTWMIGYDLKPAIAVGAAFAPSSLGVASNALSTGDVLNTPIGQMIVASSVFDDVFGLILLSILQVFADPNPTAFDYVLPFLSSFGYLIVLGGLGITVLPRIIEHHILPRIGEPFRDAAAMVLLCLLTVVYMLALNYSRASYLTGVFLAGLTFCQLHYVHAYFVQHGRDMLNWLLRIFFAATIGFQVPITQFQSGNVLRWGSMLVFAVFAKMPLGFFVPRFQREIPQDFPYNPYHRDVIVTALAMTCRGEFNVIVASYALSQGLFTPDVYSAVIFAILTGSIVSPLVLTKVLKYYNDHSLAYLRGTHPIERIGNTCDGSRPLFLAIQARTPVQWNLQEAFKKTLEEMGLIIIDHRSWHTLGRQDIDQEAVDITELFVQDTKLKVRVSNCFDVRMRSRSSSGSLATLSPSGKVSPTFELIEGASDGKSTSESSGSGSQHSSERLDDLEAGMKEEEDIDARCLAVRQALADCLHLDDDQDYAIQVTQWVPFVVDKPAVIAAETTQKDALNRDRFFSFHSAADEIPEPQLSASTDSPQKGGGHRRFFSFSRSMTDEIFDGPDAPSVGGLFSDDEQDAAVMPKIPLARKRSHGSSPNKTLNRKGSHMSGSRDNNSNTINPHATDGPCLQNCDLWEIDDRCHNATRDGDYLEPDCTGHGEHILIEGLGGVCDDPPARRHRRAHTFDAGMLSDANPGLEQRDLETNVIRDRLHGYVRHLSSQYD